MSGYRELRSTQKVERPGPVTVIALFQFAKAAFFLFVAAQLLSQPLVGTFSDLNLSRMITVVSADGSAMITTAIEVIRGRTPAGVSPEALAAVLALVGVWLIYVGWGLWRLKEWARKTRVGISILQALGAMTVLTVYLPSREGAPLSSGQWRDLFLHLVVNLAMVFYLMWDVNVVKYFVLQEQASI
jgi:hypothetical protein